MRLREMREILAEVLPELSVTFESTTLQSSARGYAVLRRRDLDHALETLGAFETFADEVVELLALYGREPGDPAMIAAATHEEMSRRLKTLRYRVETHIELLDSVLPAADPLAIAVRLPHVDNLGDLRSTIAEVAMALDHSSRLVTGDGVRFVGFDSGSEWLELVAATSVVFHYVARIIRIAVDHQRKGLENRRIESLIGSTEVAGENLAAVSNALQAQLTSSVRLCAEKALKDFGRAGLDDGQRAEALNATIAAAERLMSLYERSAEVQMALGAASAPPPDAPSAAEQRALWSPAPNASQLTEGRTPSASDSTDEAADEAGQHEGAGEGGEEPEGG